MRRGTVVALVLAATLVMISATKVGEAATEQETLAGLPSVYVIVERISNDLTRAGLSEETLKTDVELRLRGVGIRVLTTKEEWLKTPGMPYLYVKVTGLTATPPGGAIFYVTGVELQLNQLVTLQRAPSVWCGAITWSTGGITIGGNVEVVRRQLRDCADQFANAYLAANPKS